MDNAEPLFPGAIIPTRQMAELTAHVQQVSDARSQQKQILEAADAEARSIIEATYEASKKECEERLQLVSDVAERKLAEELVSLEPEVARLVTEIVESIIGKMDKNEAIRRSTRMALAQLSDHKLARIRAAPKAIVPVSQVVAEIDEPAIVEVSIGEEMTGDRVVFSSDRTVAEIGLTEQVRTAVTSWADKET